MTATPTARLETTRFLRRGRRFSNVQHVYEGMRRSIIDLDMPPGSLISKHDVAASFGVSQTPVREALLRLEDEGLVEIFPQSRTVVSLIDVQHAREAQFLRLSVEVEIARTLSVAITEGQVAELRSLVGRQATELQAGNLSRFTVYDNEFHARTYELAGVGGLWEIICTRRAHIDRLRQLHLPVKGRAKTILKQHRAILAALASRDAQAAERSVREHLRGTLAASDEIRSQYPQYFQ